MDYFTTEIYCKSFYAKDCICQLFYEKILQIRKNNGLELKQVIFNDITSVGIYGTWPI